MFYRAAPGTDGSGMQYQWSQVAKLSPKGYSNTDDQINSMSMYYSALFVGIANIGN